MALYSRDTPYAEFARKTNVFEIYARYKSLLVKFNRIKHLFETHVLRGSITPFAQDTQHRRTKVQQELFEKRLGTLFLSFPFYLDLFFYTTFIANSNPNMNGNLHARIDFSSFINMVDFLFYDNTLAKYMIGQNTKTIGETMNAMYADSSTNETFTTHLFENIDKITVAENKIYKQLNSQLASLKKQHQQQK